MKNMSEVKREAREDGKLTCKVCGHRWRPRVSEPQWCPKCGSQNWNVGRQRPPIAEQRADAQERKLRESLKIAKQHTAALRKGERVPLPADQANVLLAQLGEWVQPSGHRYLLAGTGHAGPWRDVTHESENAEYISDYELLGWNRDHDMALRITANYEDGECLIGDNIYPGDSLHFRAGLVPEAGEIVLAVGESCDGRVFATIKHWHPVGEGLVELRSSNARCAPILARESDLEIHGVLINHLQTNYRERARMKQQLAQKARETATEKVKAAKEKVTRSVTTARAASTRATGGKRKIAVK